MKIGIIIGAILGVLLIIISLVWFFMLKSKGRQQKWPLWFFIAGFLALLTSFTNALKMIISK